VKAKIGNPKDYTENNKDGVFNTDCPKQKTSIPKEVIQQQIIKDGGKCDDAELSDDDKMEAETDDCEQGEKKLNADYYTPIKALSTFIYDWRIKARLTKKGIRKTYKNARSEGYFMNVELMDAHGTMI
jgi:hypothetical protein